jgi:hypothetical protein
MSVYENIGNADYKKELLFFLAALFFGFNCSLKWKLVKATVTAEGKNANDYRMTY